MNQQPGLFEETERVLHRYTSICAALEERRRWFQGRIPFRYAAVALAEAEGEAGALADRVIAEAEVLLERARWSSPLRTPLRFGLAAALARRGQTAAGFADDMEQALPWMREAGLSRNVYAVIALLVLRDAEGVVTRQAVERLGTFFRAMKERHPWITDAADLPHCATFALRPEPPEQVMARVEGLYRCLREAGFGQGDSLQRTTHLLYFHPRSVEETVGRVVTLREEIREDGVAVWHSDWDELALLAYLDAPSSRVAEQVLALRKRLQEGIPAIDRFNAFSLAANLAVRSGGAPVPAELLEAKVLVDLQTLVDDQNASLAASSTV